MFRKLYARTWAGFFWLAIRRNDENKNGPYSKKAGKFQCVYFERLSMIRIKGLYFKQLVSH
jgi:hypothetical protein